MGTNEETCPECKGRGICNHCRGLSKQCAWCMGDSKCPKCGGTGKI